MTTRRFEVNGGDCRKRSHFSWFLGPLLYSVIFVNENENENVKTAQLVTQRKC